MKQQLLLFLLICLFVSCTDEDIFDTPNISIDLAKLSPNVKSMSGFLHGVGESKPSDSIIEKLQPRLLRTGSRIHSLKERKKKFGSQVIVVLSDLWHAYSNGNSFMPYEDYDRYRSFLKNELDKIDDPEIIFDIWNEPDEGNFWIGTPEQFYETFAVAHDVIREKYGDDAVITGPSSHWKPEFIQAFLDYCLNRGVKLDILSWHEFQSGNDLSKVKANLNYARNTYIINSKYASLNIREIQINEYGFHDVYQVPASMLGYLYYLERGGADAACRTCWSRGCWNNTLSGLITSDNIPTPLWWVYRAYARSIDHRLVSSTSNKYITPFAYLTPGEATFAEILVGNHYTSSVNDIIINLNNIDVVFPDLDQIRVSIIKIPDSQSSIIPLSSLESELITDQTIPVSDGKARINLNVLTNNDAYIIELYKN
ncbi:hypothetical protein PZB74_09090 [Porifericola rhodea]|uniref:GH39 family glycosyl hydrolase n=1 Tax=Porifericola rhodea TaxID=930972 RepID=UPI0026663153|nr:hypothetical protein [Porifericola rhodea]WKN33485.1 hypothetical protein PZB74_09090 [Porifericola rhodea]